jgi:DNA-binding GntR family transcriptional regulator
MGVRVSDAKAERNSAMAAIVASAQSRYPTAQEVVLESLRQAILEGVLPPGTRLRQEDLASIMGSRSRLPVREALRALEYEGLVDSTPHRGFTVTGLNPEDIEEIYDIRIVLESHATRLAVPLLTDQDLAALTALYDQMNATDNPDEQLAAREEFYLRLYSVTTRPRLVGMISRLRQEVARSLRWRLVQHSPEHHRIFFEAVIQRDADLATAELASHYRKVAALLRRFLREAEQEGNGSQNHR